jgi:hypothetical protein
MRKSAIDEIKQMEIDFSENLDENFYGMYGHDFNPKWWNCTTAEFLKELKNILTD